MGALPQAGRLKAPQQEEEPRQDLGSLGEGVAWQAVWRIRWGGVGEAGSLGSLGKPMEKECREFIWGESVGKFGGKEARAACLLHRSEQTSANPTGSIGCFREPSGGQKWPSPGAPWCSAPGPCGQGCPGHSSTADPGGAGA